jgi:putative phosphoesterase
MSGSFTELGDVTSEPIEVGVISDTHGLVRPEALAALRGVARILHAGDIGTPDVLARLATIAPVVAVRGNVDRDAWAAELPETCRFELAGRRVFMTHRLSLTAPDAVSLDADIVVFGHSHRPESARRDGVLFLNPGSAGPRRFRLPVAVARLRFARGKVRPQLIELDV